MKHGPPMAGWLFIALALLALTACGGGGSGGGNGSDPTAPCTFDSSTFDSQCTFDI